MVGREGRETMEVGKSGKVSFKARKKLIAGERKCLTRAGRSRTDDCGGVICVSGAKNLRFIGREFHKRREELRNHRSANLSLVETGERERHR